MTIKALLEDFYDMMKDIFKNTREIYKNPKSNELDPSVRGVITKNGDLYTSTAFHTDIAGVLYKKGVLKNIIFSSSKINPEAIFVQRLEKTNKFYMSEITTPKLNKESREIINKVFVKAKKKNPRLIFYKTKITKKS